MHDEAVSAFYKANIFDYFDYCCQLGLQQYKIDFRARNVRTKETPNCWSSTVDGLKLIGRLHPTIRTMTIRYDYCMALWDGPLRDFITKTGKTMALRCIGVGLFKYDTEKGIKVYFEHQAMASAWRQMRFTTPLSSSLLDASLRSTDKGYAFGWDQGLALGMNKELNLCTWLKIYEEWRREKRNSILDKPKLGSDLLRSFEFLLPGLGEHVIHNDLPDNLQLRHVAPGKQSPEVLEWVTEILTHAGRKCRHLFKISD